METGDQDVHGHACHSACEHECVHASGWCKWVVQVGGGWWENEARRGGVS